jgi:hypothetical protein
LTIHGLSQSTGAERTLSLGQSAGAVLLHARDTTGADGLPRVAVPLAGLLGALADRPAGGTAVGGESPGDGSKAWLDVEVRRNEVLLRTRAEAGSGWDIAVGLDDFQDALEAATADFSTDAHPASGP